MLECIRLKAVFGIQVMINITQLPSGLPFSKQAEEEILDIVKNLSVDSNTKKLETLLDIDKFFDDL